MSVDPNKFLDPAHGVSVHPQDASVEGAQTTSGLSNETYTSPGIVSEGSVAKKSLWGRFNLRKRKDGSNDLSVGPDDFSLATSPNLLPDKSAQLVTHEFSSGSLSFWEKG